MHFFLCYLKRRISSKLYRKEWEREKSKSMRNVIEILLNTHTLTKTHLYTHRTLQTLSNTSARASWAIKNWTSSCCCCYWEKSKMLFFILFFFSYVHILKHPTHTDTHRYVQLQLYTVIYLSVFSFCSLFRKVLAFLHLLWNLD